MKNQTAELSIIQRTHDLIMWYIPTIEKFPRDKKFTLGERIINRLYEIYEELITARYQSQKLEHLKQINGKLDVIRQQIRLVLDFKLIDAKQFFHVSKLINEIGTELGGWIRQQKGK